MFCSTYEGLVRTLRDAMAVDREKLSSEPEAGFDYADIISWMGLVDFKGGKAPDVRASLLTSRKKRKIAIDVPQQTALERIDKEAPIADVIYTMALAEAKMKVIAEVAGEVYPAVAFQIKDLHRDWEIMRDEVLKDRRERVSLKGALGILEKKRVMTAASLIVITGLLLSACGPVNGSGTATSGGAEQPTISATNYELAAEPTRTPTPIWTATPVPTETALPTLTPEATVAPAPEGLASVPEGYSAVQNPDLSWGYAEGIGADADNIPHLTVDSDGAHFSLGAVEIDIPTADMHDRITVGQEGALQIYNEAGTGIDYAWDTVNNEWIVASEVLWMDVGSPENFTPILTMADLEELARRERMVLPPFPENTYFPPLDKILYGADLQSATRDQSVEYNFFSPFGGLPEGMTSPFRPVNMIVLKANEAEGRPYDSYILTEQVFNPDDGSFSLMHFGGYADISTAPGLGIRDFTERVELVTVGTSVHPSIYMLPWHRFEPVDIPMWDVWNEWSYLSPEVHDLDSSLVMTEILALIDEWFSSGHVPARLEELILRGILLAT